MEKEEEGDGVSGITSHGGLKMLKIRKWYFPLFQMSSSGFLFVLLLFLEEMEALRNMQKSSTELYVMLIY